MTAEARVQVSGSQLIASAEVRESSTCCRVSVPGDREETGVYKGPGI